MRDDTARGGSAAPLSELPVNDIWTDDQVHASGLPVNDSRLVCVGGGLGSLTLVDFLRVAGVSSDDIRVVSPHQQPHATFRYLCATSGMGPDDPMRSDSMSRVDNIWGFPSYAVQEALLRRRITPLWRVLTEPLFSEFYNPTLAAVCAGVEREAARIGWSRMLTLGQVSMVRRRAGGGYFVVLEPASPEAGGDRVAHRCEFVHLAVGYPALRVLADIQDFRARHSDHHRVVHAYEPHDHVYQALAIRPGTVLVRGTGIAASRILQRLIEDRDQHGMSTTIVHLVRRYVPSAQGHMLFHRPAAHGVARQAFTFAKSAGGGQLRDTVAALDGAERGAFITAIGGTTTPARRVWLRQLARGGEQGWYRVLTGQVARLDQTPEGKVAALIQPHHGPPVTVDADYVIDATGLDGDIRRHSLLADLLDHTGARLNPLGRLDVDVDFEVRGTRSGHGRLYASGMATLGGYLAPVDSFWGLSHAALEICDSLARAGFCRRIGMIRSVTQWWRWMRNLPI